ncbi:copper resistance protein CopZ [Ensifer sp. Root31]|uniref:nitrous oxide reductase accessory protein NosL n=2 Tax=Ensifer TaxID=106591 RepID=UPI00046D3272|nr:copper resistance protein CopZ [Ensifer sp. Root31]NOV16650.1 copper resistance protein CopZ [Ensifer canadensis]OMQ46565.1 copper resistance protein CopZ [Ensifer sp. 1H6]
MKTRNLVAVAMSAFVLVGCAAEEADSPPLPYSLTDDAMGRYCGMNVLEHPGPKGQVILKQIPEPIWFSSARDTVAFTLLPEEPKEIAAIYVSDMGKAPTWEKPGADNWIDAKSAFYVVGSRLRGGMGAAEAVPFSSRQDALSFTERHGGQIVGFGNIPQDYVLGADGASPALTSFSEPAEASHD